MKFHCSSLRLQSKYAFRATLTSLDAFRATLTSLEVVRMLPYVQEYFLRVMMNECT